jgi:hypothetical protein
MMIKNLRLAVAVTVTVHRHLFPHIAHHMLRRSTVTIALLSQLQRRLSHLLIIIDRTLNTRSL